MKNQTQSEINPNENKQLLYIDLFYGNRGTSTGVENAMNNGRKIAKVIVCVKSIIYGQTY
jgi:hypothetical protein